MTKPPRFPSPDHGARTYFVTAITWERRPIFLSERLALLFLDSLQQYRARGSYLLHDFTLMPEHFHVILTPTGMALERALQFIKGGFSHRVAKELNSQLEIWQRGFTDHRLRDARDYDVHRAYIHGNAVRRRLAERAEEYPYCSASERHALDRVPEYLRG